MKLWPFKQNYTKKLRKTQAKYIAQTQKLRGYVTEKLANKSKYKNYNPTDGQREQNCVELDETQAIVLKQDTYEIIKLTNDSAITTNETNNENNEINENNESNESNESGWKRKSALHRVTRFYEQLKDY